ncbi:protein tyrosine phosphatase 10D isoform X2 [Rhodnius prolixus]|uniref:protein tyrosine phosphatase 10D isoform X2 n=1 Tax=Rhodnius prolixus TaxID=13249 RepID=UPI003D18AE1B
MVISKNSIWLAISFGFILLTKLKICQTAELVIQIPENLSQDNSTYRLDYSPPHGHPPPNTTIPSRELGHVIQFSRGLPGTKYEFWLYYSNSTLRDWLTWTASITTAPDPPSNLTVTVRNGRSALINFSPPALGHYSSFKMKVISLAEPSQQAPRTIQLENASPYALKDLTPGGTYSIQLFTVYDNKESIAYTSKNFTTKPNTPGKFIVWFRNETTLLVLWQPSYPASIYTHYKVSIEPPDAAESMLYVEKEGEPPGPAQAAFKALVPGRAYNISVQTVSEDEISPPTTAQYRTIPLRPVDLRYDKSSVTAHSFTVLWDPPKGQSEFDKYQISINLRRQGSVAPILRNREEPTEQTFKDGLEPGLTYHVLVKTVSGKVTSWPAAVNVTLKPLPVKELKSEIDNKTNDVTLTWRPDNSSFQDEYKISYTEVGVLNGDTNTMVTDKTEHVLESLLPGRNYSISVQAVSNSVESNAEIAYQATRPSSPVIEDLKPIEYGLNISWKSDVNSRQEKYEVIHLRNDSGLKSVTTVTTEPHLLLTNLYPGAGYQIKVFAISHGLYSEPHDYFQAVYPKPPTNLTLENVTSNSVVVRWIEPEESIYSEFSIRYRTEEESRWYKLPPVKRTVTEAEVVDLTPGEKYTIQVNTVSFNVESARPLVLNHTVRPNPVTDIAPLVDSTNVTLEFPRPEGRIEYYIINWSPLESNGEEIVQRTRNMTGKGTEGGSVRALVEDLMPGVKYQFDIRTVSYELQSDVTTLSARTMPLILSEVLVVNNAHLTDTVTLRYTPTPQASSRFDRYRFSLIGAGDASGKGALIKEKGANETESKVTFNNLTPGRLYNITVWTVADRVLSQPLHRQDRLYPEHITKINATQITDTAITLTWDKPPGEYNAFEVQYLNTEGILIQNLTQEETITINELKPHRNYTFTVVVRSGMEATILRKSLPISAVFITQESIPGKVEKFDPIDVQPSEITFEWSLPNSEQNGVILKFTITYGLESSYHTQNKNFKADDFRGTIRNLLPGKTYVFSIQAETRVGYGPEAIWKQKMPILAPPKPSDQVVPTEVCRTSTTIQIRFRKNYFSDQNGPVIAYTIIIAEDDTKNASGLEMPSWRDVQAYSVWPPYQVLEPYYPFKNGSVEDFTIGTEDCEGKLTGYCNGPLKGGTTYRVKIRAFTTSDKFTDTHYSFSIQTDQDTTPLIIGITIPSAIILVLLVVVLLLRRNKILGRKPAENRTNDTLSLPDSIIETSRPIRLENFAEHYRIMSADSDFRFSEEFEELKHVGREQPCTFADLSCNRPKNRFTNILPYDHSRFKLQPVDDEEGSDYINANYVPGWNSPREFIVTQGPLHSTRDDFWRMCWESNSRAIVMLTRCIEKGREKCDHYWPYDTMPVYYGDISVTILNDSHYPDWSITEFIMARGDTQRVIRHFHFTTWPDFGVPNPPTTLVRFVRAFRERISPEQRPIVVHCSAGVGRSGTFIALDRILQSLNHGTDHVDIFGIVWAMRKERVWMVQTEQQYICIHQCLLAVLEGEDNQTPPREIHHNQGFEGKSNDNDSGVSSPDFFIAEKQR